MCRRDSTTSSKWYIDELQLDRRLDIGIESSYACLKHYNDLHSNRNIRYLYKYSRIDSDGEP